VTLARQLADIGYTSLRFDVDSPEAQSGLEVYGQPGRELMIRHVQLAMDYLSTALGHRTFVLFGVCTGADHAVDVAEVDDRVGGLILVDDNVFCLGKSPVDLFSSRIKCLLSYSEQIMAIEGFQLPTSCRAGNPVSSGTLQVECPAGLDHLLISEESQVFIRESACSWLQNTFGRP